MKLRTERASAGAAGRGPLRRPASEAPAPASSAPAAAAGEGARVEPVAAAEGAPNRRRRRGLGWRARDAGAATVGVVSSGVMLLATLVMTVASLIAILIALAIVLRDVDANAHNTIVKAIHEGANFFAGSFTGLIAFTGHPKRAITVDWGIALLVYLLVGGVIAGYIARIARGGRRFQRRHSSVVR